MNKLAEWDNEGEQSHALIFSLSSLRPLDNFLKNMHGYLRAADQTLIICDMEVAFSSE